MAQLQQKWQYEIVDGEHVINSEIVVHEFIMEMIHYDDDITVHVGSYLLAWQNSEAGIWVTENALHKPRWQAMNDNVIMATKVVVIARLSEPNQTYFRLRFL